MKKIIALIAVLAGNIFLFTTTSAQFTPAPCEGQSHCSAPTKGINYKNSIMYLGKQGEEFDL